jgi:hypothetical protein
MSKRENQFIGSSASINLRHQEVNLRLELFTDLYWRTCQEALQGAMHSVSRLNGQSVDR